MVNNNSKDRKEDIDEEDEDQFLDIENDKDEEDNDHDFTNAIDNEQRDKVIRFFIKNIVASLRDIQDGINIPRQVADDHVRILKNEKIIQSIHPPITNDKIKHLGLRIQRLIREREQNENGREVILYFFDVDKFINRLKKLFKHYFPDDSRGDLVEIRYSPIISGYKAMTTSIDFMENIPAKGKMDIVSPQNRSNMRLPI